MIITLKVRLLRGRYHEHEWSAEIELNDSSTLDVLHYAIWRAVEFSDDHLYCFYISRTDRSRTRQSFDVPCGSISQHAMHHLHSQRT